MAAQEEPGAGNGVPRTPDDPEKLVPILEALLFASPEPLGTAALGRALGEDVPRESIRKALELLQERTAAPGRGVLLVEVAGGWQLVTREECFPWVRGIAKTRAEEKLTAAAIETLATIAYKQPVTRADIDAIRGVASGPVVRSLMDRGLVRVVGRAELPGAPFLYGTTRRFLEHFGLRSVKDLPDQKELSRLLSEQAR